MSTQEAERQGRKARHASTIEELGVSTKKAIDELSREVKNLAQRLSKVERSQR